MKPLKEFKIKFDQNNEMMMYDYYWQSQNVYHEEDNHIFPDRLEYAGNDGRHIKLKSLNTNRTFWLFLSNFDEILKNKKMLLDNIIEGEFYYIRKGSRIGLRMVLPDPPKKIRTP